jgi:hypothetical protein
MGILLIESFSLNLGRISAMGKFLKKKTPACYERPDKSDKYHVNTASVKKAVTEVTDQRGREL